MSDRLVHAAGKLAGLMRMHTDSEPHSRPDLPNPDRSPGFVVVTRCEDAQRSRHARTLCARDHRLQVPGEFLARQVAMGIDHLTLVPGEIS